MVCWPYNFSVVSQFSQLYIAISLSPVPTGSTPWILTSDGGGSGDHGDEYPTKSDPVRYYNSILQRHDPESTDIIVQST